VSDEASVKTNGYLAFKERKPDLLMRRVQGEHDIRFDGIQDIVNRAHGNSVFDIGCNRGLAGYEMARNGAIRVFGCDNYEDGIIACRHLFADLRAVPHQFEVLDLTGGEAAYDAAFGVHAKFKHDITIMLATYHKLARIMSAKNLSDLMKFFGSKTNKYFAWRGYEEEIPVLDKDLGSVGLKRIHTSLISDIQPAAIWARM
jgi:hypothetical protein